ncbi:MAG: cache domain-containing protein, partial [Nitrospirae bacterium]|nr:cache domain-containing protein [Nitrospirota bacterium]
MKTMNSLKSGGFRSKLFFIMGGGSIWTIIALTTVWLAYAWFAVGNTVHRDLQVIASRTAGEIDQYLTGKIDSLMAVKEVLSYPDEDRFKLQLMLKRISLEFNQFNNLALFDTSNKLIASSSSDKNTPLSEEILNIVKRGKEYRSPMLFTKGNLPYIRVALPLFWQVEVFRILLAEVDILHVWNKVDGIRIGDTGRASILSKEGVFLADGDKSRVLKMQRWQDTISSMTPLEGTEGLIDANDRNGRSLDIAYAEISSTGWMLIITQEHRESLHFLYVMFYWAAATMIAALFGAYYLSSNLSSRLSKPI